jgi:amidase
VPSVCGPLTTSLSTLEYFTAAVLAGEPWLLDPVTIPLPWRYDLAAKPIKPLRIGYYYDDGAVRVQPPLEYAVRKVVSALFKAGHERKLTKFHNKSTSNPHLVFEWDTSEHARGWDLWLKGVLADGGRRCRLQCEKENEPLIEGMLVGTKKDELNVVEGEEVRASV